MAASVDVLTGIVIQRPRAEVAVFAANPPACPENSHSYVGLSVRPATEQASRTNSPTYNIFVVIRCQPVVLPALKIAIRTSDC